MAKRAKRGKRGIMAIGMSAEGFARMSKKSKRF